MEKALLLTLACETAVRNDRWDEVALLLEAREKVLDELEKAPLPAPETKLAQLRAANEQLMKRIREAQRSLNAEGQKAFQASRARGAYRATL